MDLHFDDTSNVVGEAAIVLLPVLSSSEDLRSPDARLDEAVGLAAAIDLAVVDTAIVNIARPTPATLFGTGKVNIEARIEHADHDIKLAIVDAQLSPVQHRNLEKAWNVKVLDRTALILEIFGDRAQTAEGRLQVELAHLSFQRSRLVRSWTHLERQRGGAGFLGGPGERQIESDRRALATKIDRISVKLEQVRRTRTLQRSKRKRSDLPVVALVGYTNAGKSTLFNHVTGSEILAKNMLLATLDPTMRAVTLPSGQDIILSDTVGFISDLPTQLVAAFRSTLEEVTEADIIVHVRDISHPDTEAQRADVIDILDALGVDPDEMRPTIEIFNKSDLLDDATKTDCMAIANISRENDQISVRDPVRICTSAFSGEGIDNFLDLVDEFATASHKVCEVFLSPADGAARAWLHERGDVLSDRHEEGGSTMVVRLNKEAQGQFESRFSHIRFTSGTSDISEKRA